METESIEERLTGDEKLTETEENLVKNALEKTKIVINMENDSYDAVCDKNGIITINIKKPNPNGGRSNFRSRVRRTHKNNRRRRRSSAGKSRKHL